MRAEHEKLAEALGVPGPEYFAEQLLMFPAATEMRINVTQRWERCVQQAIHESENFTDLNRHVRALMAKQWEMEKKFGKVIFRRRT